MFVLDPRLWLADPAVKPFERDFRADITAPDITIIGLGKYLIASYPVKKGNILIVKNLVPYAMERTDVNTTTEDFAYIQPDVADGHFLYEPRVNGQAPYIVAIDYNAPRIDAGTLLNADRILANGYSDISARPKYDASNSWNNPLFTFIVPADTTFEVAFSILRGGTTSPMPDPYTVGAGERRVDFAGIYVVGLEMTEQTYRDTYNKVAASKDGV